MVGIVVVAGVVASGSLITVKPLGCSSCAASEHVQNVRQPSPNLHRL